jgi:hypothetical protein
MDKPFRLRGTIEPPWLYQDLDEDSVTGTTTIAMSIRQGVLEVGFDAEADEPKARDLVNNYVAALNLLTETKIRIELNQSWRQTRGVIAIGIKAEDAIKLTEHVRVALKRLAASRQRVEI